MARLRHIIPALLAAAAVATTAAARTAADFFTSAPDSVIPLLTGVTRLDMCDYHAAGSTRASTNRLGGHSRVTSQSPLLIEYELTDSATGSVALLVAGSDTVVAVVTTAAMPAPDSEIRLYDTSWRPLPAPAALPSYTDWLTDAGRADIERATSLVPFVTGKATFDPEAQTLTLTGGAEEYVAPSLRGEVARLFRPQIVIRCEGGKLRRL
ncbi:MAG: DUF3256 family protein [Bacteroides sp.]|nr:DUF3256 family protein [Bacteroides sp.]